MIHLHEVLNSNIYAYARLSTADFWCMRYGGDGLGNLLFCWARCLVTARRNGWRMIWPTWFSFKPKNWRSNPYDVRTYGNLFHPTAEYSRGGTKFVQLAAHRWVSESSAAKEPPTPGSVVIFRGMAGKFQPFVEELDAVKAALIEMTRPQHLSGYTDRGKESIGIHVRRGDFIRRPDPEATKKLDNSALPLSWYMAALEAVRARLGYPAPAQVYSDGTEEELRPLLNIPAVARFNFGSSIADMLAISRSSLLIASGSSFSMWASYLGQVPTIWHPGKLLQSVHLGPERREVEWAKGDPLPDWICHSRHARSYARGL